MDRRRFLAASIATATLVPLAAWAKNEVIAYEPGVVQALLDDGKTVLVDFATDWCPTCRTQERAIQSLRNKTPAYNKHIVFVRLDWDIYARSELSKRLKIPRRSTLVLLRGTQELGRNVAGTSLNSIRHLLDLGLEGTNGT